MSKVDDMLDTIKSKVSAVVGKVLPSHEEDASPACRTEDSIDRANKDSFPASDPPGFIQPHEETHEVCNGEVDLAEEAGITGCRARPEAKPKPVQETLVPSGSHYAERA